MDTDPNSEVSSLMAALGDSTEVESTLNEGEEEAQETTEDTIADEQHTEDESSSDENSDEAEPGVVIEFDGKTWEFPAGTPPQIAEGVKKIADDLKADYTRKTQATAEESKRIKAQATQLQEAQQIAVNTLEKRIELEKITDQIKSLEEMDFESLVERDPQQAIRLQARYAQLQAAAARGKEELGHLAMQEQQKILAEKQRLKAELVQKASEIIPGYNAKIDKELLETVSECGFSKDEIDSITDPRLLKLINLARMGRQVQKVTPKTLQKVAAAPKVVTTQAKQQPKQNQAALDRLKKSGRAENLTAFL
jgi:hypothetical protein